MVASAVATSGVSTRTSTATGCVYAQLTHQTSRRSHFGTRLLGRKDVNAANQSRCPDSRGDVGDTRRDENESLSTLTTLCMSSCLREGQILVKRSNTTLLFALFSNPFEDCALNPFCFFDSCLSNLQLSKQTSSVSVLLSAVVTSRLAHSRWQFEAWLHRLESMDTPTLCQPKTGLHRTVAVHQHWSLRRPLPVILDQLDAMRVEVAVGNINC